MNKQYRDIIVAVLAACFVLVVAIPLIGISAAIAIPKGYVEWFKSNLGIEVGLFIWGVLVIQLIGVGVSTIVATFLSVRYSTLKWFYVSAIIFVVILGGSLSMQLMSTPINSYIGFPWWMHSQEPVIAICVLAGGLLARRVQ